MSNETKPDGFPNRAYESGYERGRRNESSAEGFIDGWFENQQEKDDRNRGYEQGRQDRLRYDNR